MISKIFWNNIWTCNTKVTKKANEVVISANSQVSNISSSLIDSFPLLLFSGSFRDAFWLLPGSSSASEHHENDSAEAPRRLLLVCRPRRSLLDRVLHIPAILQTPRQEAGGHAEVPPLCVVTRYTSWCCLYFYGDCLSLLSVSEQQKSSSAWHWLRCVVPIAMVVWLKNFQHVSTSSGWQRGGGTWRSSNTMTPSLAPNGSMWWLTMVPGSYFMLAK